MLEPHEDLRPTPGRDERVRRALIQYAATHRRRRRWWMVLAPSIALVVALTGGTIALLLPVWNETTAHCLARAEITGEDRYTGTSVSYAPDGDGPQRIADAIEACDQVWRDGLLDPESPDGMSRDESGVPVLVPRTPPRPVTVCVMRDGAAAVVPGEDGVCSMLGLGTKLP